MDLFALLPISLDEPIKPDDVYARVLVVEQRIEALYRLGQWVLGALCVFCLLVILQIASKFLIFGRVVRVLRAVEHLLSLNEKQAKITDGKADELHRAVKETGEEVKREIPPAVAAVVAAVAAGPSADGSGLRVVPVNPPDPPAAPD